MKPLLVILVASVAVSAGAGEAHADVNASASVDGSLASSFGCWKTMDGSSSPSAEAIGSTTTRASRAT
jgi:hypothetical protein